MGLKSGGSKLGRGGSLNRGSSDGGSITPPVTGTPVDWLIDFAGATNALVTTAVLDASLHGSLIGTWEYNNGTPTHTRLVAPSGLTRFSPLAVGGTDYSAATKVLKFDFDEAAINVDTWEGFLRNLGAGTLPADYSLTALIRFNGINSSDANNDYLVLTSDGFAVAQTQLGSGGAGAGYLKSHGQVTGGSSSLGRGITYAANTWYILWLRHNATDHRVEVALLNNATGALVACTEAALDGSPLVYFILQDYLILPESGKTEIAMLAGDGTNAAFCPGVTIPQPTSPLLDQTASSQLTFSWSGTVCRWKIERSANLGVSWSTLETAWTDAGGSFSFAYVDTTVVNLGTYRYRITGLMGDGVTSTPLVTTDLTINNTSFTDVLDFATAEASADTDNTFVIWQSLSLPAGTISKLRIKSGATYNSAVATKLALYDNSGNIVGDVSYYPEISINAIDTIFECTLSTPVVIGAGTYKIAFQTNNGSNASYRYHATGGTRNYAFAGAYASFPTASLPASDGSDAVATAMGALVI